MPIVHDFDTAAAFLHTRGKPVPRKKLSNNTYLEREDADTIHVRLHRTNIITYRPDTITLDSGGWLTVTTKARMNDHIPFPFRVSSVKGVWFVERWLKDDRTSVRYQDGTTLVRTAKTYEQTWSYPGAEPSWWRVDERTIVPESQAQKDDRHNAAMRKLVGRYAKGYTTDTMVDAPVDACRLCCVAEHRDVGRGYDRDVRITWGDKMEDTQHLIDHMLDGSYNQGMIFAALSEKGYIVHPNHGVDTIRRCLRAYLSQRLFVGATAPAHGKKPVSV